MYMRNLLKPADYVSFIPVGVQMTLQYNESGNLEKVYTGFADDRKLCDAAVMTTLLNAHTIPSVIPVTKGTSWVFGVLYTGQPFAASGVVPESVYPDALSLFISNPSQYNFFGINITSTALTFIGATPIRQCLHTYKFKTLPGWLVPANFTDAKADEWVHNSQYPFNPDLTAGLAVFRKGAFILYSLNTYQRIVLDIVKYTDVHGYIKATVSFTNGTSTSVDYSDIVTYNIHVGTVCVFNSLHQIIYAYAGDSKKHTAYNQNIVCAYCGKSIRVPVSGEVVCSNTHCTSTIVLDIMHFCNCLGISTMGLTADNFVELIRNKQITCLTDIFTLPQFASLSNINATLATLVRSVVPVSIIAPNDIFVLLANRCSNNERTVRYYLLNPSQIQPDLNITHPQLNTLVAWLSDGCNLSDILSVLDLPMITIQNADKKFDGAPMFRGKRLYITGKFIHGDSAEIISILQSYSAIVVTQMDDTVNGVLVGGKQEDIDGSAIKYANRQNIPIMNELSFFKQYNIDADLQANLVYSGN